MMYMSEHIIKTFKYITSRRLLLLSIASVCFVIFVGSVLVSNYSFGGVSVTAQTAQTSTNSVKVNGKQINQGGLDIPGDNDFFSRIGLNARILYDQNNRYLGAIDCSDAGQNFQSSTCNGFFLDGISVGDTIDPNNIPYMYGPANASAYERVVERVSGVNVTCFRSIIDNKCFAQNETGYVVAISKSATDKCATKGVKISSCTDLAKEVESKSTIIKNGLGPLTAVSAIDKTGQKTAKDNASKIAQELSKDGVECETFVDIDATVYYACTKDGKQVKPDGSAHDANCTPANGKVLFTLNANNTYADCNEDVTSSQRIQNSSINDQQVGEDGKIEEDSDLGTVLLDIMSKILLIFVWIVSGLISILLMLAFNILATFLLINPASAEFLQVAIDPWGIVLSIANVVVLFAFLYTGFRYILGVKDKKPIGDFFLNIIVVLLTINFTLFGAAAVINITQGIGDTFLGSYSSISRPGKPLAEAMFGSFNRGISQVSLIRCGNADSQLGIKGDTCPEQNQVNNIFGALISGKAGEATATITGEIVYIIIAGYALFVIWQALLIVLIRIVALWLLMVTSPFAVAAFFSPIPQLKKLADQWVEYFLNFTMLYPVMIIGFVLVGALTEAFGSAVRGRVSFSSGVNVEAASSSELFGILLPLLLVALVGIGALSLLVEFLKSFKKITDGVIEGAKALGDWGGKGLGLLARGAGALTGARLDKAIYSDKKVVRDLKSQKKLQEDEIGKIERGEGRYASWTDAQKDRATTARKQRINELNNSIKWKQASIDRMKERRNYYRGLQFLPERLEGWKRLPGELIKNYQTQRKAEEEGEKVVYDMRRELALRAAGLGDQMEGPNAKFPGLSQEKAQEMMGNTQGMEQLENRYRAEASRKILNSNSKLSKGQLMDSASKLSSSLNGDLYSQGQNGTNDFLELLEQGSGNSEVVRKLATDEKLLNLTRQAIADGLVSGETEKNLDFIVFKDSSSARRKAGSELTDEDFAKTPGHLIGSQALEEYLKIKSQKSGTRTSLEQVRSKIDIQGGVTDFGVEVAKTNNEATLAELNIEQRAVVDGVLDRLVASGIDEKQTLLQGVREARTTNGQLQDDQINNLISQAQSATFGAKNIQELEQLLANQQDDRARLATLENSKIGRMVASSDNYAQQTEAQKLALQKAATKLGMEAYDQTSGLYKEMISTAIKDQYKAAERLKAETALQNKALEELETSSRYSGPNTPVQNEQFYLTEGIGVINKAIEDIQIQQGDLALRLGEEGLQAIKNAYSKAMIARSQDQNADITDIIGSLNSEFPQTQGTINTNTFDSIHTQALTKSAERAGIIRNMSEEQVRDYHRDTSAKFRREIDRVETSVRAESASIGPSARELIASIT